MTTAPTLYTSALGNAPMFVTYFAALADIPIALKPVSIPAGEHKQPEYLAVAPSGQLPALVDGEVFVWESDAIVRYLAAKYRSDAYPLHDAERLAPIDSAYSWLWFNAWMSERDVAVQTFLIAVIRGGEPNMERIEEATGRLRGDYEFIEQTFFKTSPNHVVGDQPTVADAVLGTLLWHADDAARPAIDLAEFPRLSAYKSAMEASPEFQRTFAASKAAVAGLRKAKGMP